MTTTGGKLELEEGTGGGTMVGFKAPNTEVVSDLVWTLPSVDGTVGQALVTDGAKQLGWADGAAGATGAAGETGAPGLDGAAGLSFDITKTYPSVAALNEEHGVDIEFTPISLGGIYAYGHITVVTKCIQQFTLTSQKTISHVEIRKGS